MKSFTAITALFALGAMAAPSHIAARNGRDYPQPASDREIRDAILAERHTAQVIKAFLDTQSPSQPADFFRVAAEALATFAGADAAYNVFESETVYRHVRHEYKDAVFALDGSQPAVKGAFEALVAETYDHDDRQSHENVNKALETINYKTCCEVLPTLETVFELIVKERHLEGVDETLAKPDACYTKIVCHNK